VSDGLLDLARQERRERHDRQAAPRLAELDALVQRGDAEVRDAVALRGLRDLDRAVTVGIRLHDEQDLLRRAEQAAHRAQVGREAIEIHLGPRRDRHRHSATPLRETRPLVGATARIPPATPDGRTRDAGAECRRPREGDDPREKAA
jgi:hypothetical protein